MFCLVLDLETVIARTLALQSLTQFVTIYAEIIVFYYIT